MPCPPHVMVLLQLWAPALRLVDSRRSEIEYCGSARRENQGLRPVGRINPPRGEDLELGHNQSRGTAVYCPKRRSRVSLRALEATNSSERAHPRNNTKCPWYKTMPSRNDIPMRYYHQSPRNNMLSVMQGEYYSNTAVHLSTYHMRGR